MKKLVLCLLTCLPVLLFAQKEGMIKYTETIAMQIELPKGMEEFASQIPSSQEMKHVMYFNAENALFKNDEEGNETETVEAGSEEGGMQFRMDLERWD